MIVPGHVAGEILATIFGNWLLGDFTVSNRTLQMVIYLSLVALFPRKASGGRHSGPFFFAERSKGTGFGGGRRRSRIV